MNRHRALLMLVIGFTAPLSAQNAPAASEAAVVGSTSSSPAVGEACRYDDCSLRLAIIGLGGYSVVQGAQTKTVGKLGVFSAPNLDNLLRSVPEAVEEARRFRRSYSRSAAFLWGGSAITMIGSGLAAGNDGHPVAVGLGASGLAFMAYGLWTHGKSFNHLSRSLWLYNRSLAR